MRGVNGSSALMLWTIKEVGMGSSITVRYRDDGLYFEGDCGCETCHPEEPPGIRRGAVREEEAVGGDGAGAKRKRRGAGKRKRRIRKREIERSEQQLRELAREQEEMARELEEMSE